MIPLDDPEGHRWVRPASPPCPHCECCTARLCQTASMTNRTCEQAATPQARDAVRDCPCAQVGGNQ